MRSIWYLLNIPHHSSSLYLHIDSHAILLFFFIPPATTAIYTLSLHDALPICATTWSRSPGRRRAVLSLFLSHVISARTATGRDTPRSSSVPSAEIGRAHV